MLGDGWTVADVFVLVLEYIISLVFSPPQKFRAGVHQELFNGVVDILTLHSYSPLLPTGKLYSGTGGSDGLRPKQFWVFAQCLCFLFLF